MLDAVTFAAPVNVMIVSRAYFPGFACTGSSVETIARSHVLHFDLVADTFVLLIVLQTLVSTEDTVLWCVSARRRKVAAGTSADFRISCQELRNSPGSSNDQRGVVLETFGPPYVHIRCKQ